MFKISQIDVVWRQDYNHKRIKVATIKSNKDETSFTYEYEGVKKAKKEGFKGYPAFPLYKQTYKVNVLGILSQRIINSKRGDKNSYYNFWEIPTEERQNNLIVLALTGGTLATDSFEFLPEFNSVKSLRLISDIDIIVNKRKDLFNIKEGDSLKWKKEEYNKDYIYAIALYKEGIKIGYIKDVHNLIFKGSTESSINVVVKRIEQSAFLNKIYVSINCL